jgi:hypothetical protein
MMILFIGAKKRISVFITGADELFINPGYRDDAHLHRGHAGPYCHHRGRAIGIHDFSARNVHYQFSRPIMRTLGARIHDAAGERVVATVVAPRPSPANHYGRGA